MALRIPENSLFATLLRSPWWVSAGISAAIIAAAATLLPKDYRLAGIIAAAPWLLIAAVAAWQQLRKPSAARVQATLEALRGASWPAFSAALEEAFRSQGYSVTRLDGRLNGAQGDLELVKGGRTAIVGCKRWKASRTGIEPLREIHAAKDTRSAHECIYVCAGEITDSGRRFAEDNGIRLMLGEELAQLFPPRTLRTIRSLEKTA